MTLQAIPLPQPLVQQGGAPLTLDGLGDAALRIAVAAAIGACVALLYRASRHPQARSPAFAQTLVLLAPLIAMVTIAVGENVAAAFTLVGTLAIVRFRTAIRDSRDMAFVIFSVAVGMAVGTFDMTVAVAGAATVGATVLLLRWLETATGGGSVTVLRMVLSPPEAAASVYAAVLGRHARSFPVLRSAIDRDRGELEVLLAVRGLDTTRSPALLVELLEVPEVVRAAIVPEENA